MSTIDRHIGGLGGVSPRSGAPEQSRPHNTQAQSAAPLTQALAWAVQLNDYVCGAEHEAASFHDRLAHLSAQFDRAHARVLALGLPLRASQDVRWASHLYRVVLTEDGLEYQAVR